MTLVFLQYYHCYNIPRRLNSVGTLNTRGWENLRFSTEIAVYVGSGMR